MFYRPTTKGNHCTLIVTALHIALNDRPLYKFPDLINLQKNNGFKFLEGKSQLTYFNQKFVFKFNIANVSMNSMNRPS